MLRVPPGKALVQSLDVLAPLVNDPARFGAIAAANALSDIYAMGGEPWCALNIAFFPTSCLDLEILRAMAQGGADMLREAGALLVGGHTVDDAEIRFGFSVTGLVDADAIAVNDALRPGDLIFWADNPNDATTIRHVAIYSGNGRMVEAPRPGVAVRETAVRWDADLMPYAGRP